MGTVAVINFSVVAAGLQMTRHWEVWPWTGIAKSDSPTDSSVTTQGMSAAAPASEPYGAGSRVPSADGSMPTGVPIKGNADSMLYHRTDSRRYGVTVAEVWFDTPERAEAAGFALAKSHPTN